MSMRNPGIYLIAVQRGSDLPLYYVGQSQNMHRRKIQHLSDLKNGRHGCQHMQNAYVKYGVDSFYFSVIDVCEVSELEEREQWWLDEIVGYERVMNVLSSVNGTCRGHVSSDMTKQKQRANALARWSSGKYREKQLEALKISRQDPEVRKTLSEAAKKRMTQERRDASRNRLLGKKQSPEFVAKRAAAISRPVIGVSIADGSIIKYNSMTAARKDGFSSNRISEVCSGIRLSHGGYKWKKIPLEI